MKTPERTVRQLFEEFKAKYTVDEVAASVQLSMLYKYLQHRCSYSNGNFTLEKDTRMHYLVEKYLKQVSPAIADRA